MREGQRGRGRGENEGGTERKRERGEEKGRAERKREA